MHPALNGEQGFLPLAWDHGRADISATAAIPFTNQTLYMRTIVFVLTASLLLPACESDPTQSPQYKQLEEDTHRTEAMVAERDSTINELFGTMNRITENLRTVRTKQGQLASPDKGMEQEADAEKRIMADIESIDVLLAENRTLIDKLRKQAKGSAKAMEELERTVSDLEASMAEKDQEITALKDQLASTNTSLATLIDMYRDKSQLADMQRSELNAAYYIVGTAKELRANGVLAKEGGVAGIGAVNKLNTESLAAGDFKRIDVVETMEIPLMAKKAKLATSHPAGSYRIEGEGEKLVITDPTAFWSASKYLVVVID